MDTLAESLMRSLEALHEIASDSPDADAVRTALSVLTSTPEGLAFLANKPITV